MTALEEATTIVAQTTRLQEMADANALIASLEVIGLRLKAAIRAVEMALGQQRMVRDACQKDLTGPVPAPSPRALAEIAGCWEAFARIEQDCKTELGEPYWLRVMGRESL